MHLTGAGLVSDARDEAGSSRRKKSEMSHLFAPNVQSRPGLFPLILFAANLLILRFFVYYGQTQHDVIDSEQPIRSLRLTPGEFAPGWAVVAWRLGSFPTDGSLAARCPAAR